AHGTWMAAGLLLAGMAIAAYLGGPFFIVMTGYYLLTTGYSLMLKRRPIVDICALALLYTLRIVAGGSATGIQLSVWLLAFSIFFFFALAAVKRHAELVENAKRGKLSVKGRGYRVEDLPLISQIGISSGYVSILVMALYLTSPNVAELYSQPAALWGICLVLLYWITRIVMVTHRGEMHDDPVVYAARDRISLICALVIFAFGVAGAML
ncbi:MAG: UbiA family prenyltransferase, partial [Cyanobacteria bacterium J06638_22]